MSQQALAAWLTGTLFLLLLVAIAFYIISRKEERAVDENAMLILRIILAVSGAAFAAVIPGFLDIHATHAELGLRAGGALAAFVILYFYNPPSMMKKNINHPGTPMRKQTPGHAIDQDLPKRTDSTK